MAGCIGHRRKVSTGFSADTACRCAGCCAIQRSMLGVTVGTACLSVYLYVIVPKGFFPQQDTGRLQGNIQIRSEPWRFRDHEPESQPILENRPWPIRRLRTLAHRISGTRRTAN